MRCVRVEIPLLAALLCAFSSAAVAAPLPGYEARFDLYRNGKLIGESRFALTVGNDRWVMTSESKGTKGLARLAGFSESSRSEGDWVEDRPRPMRFEQQVNSRIKDVSSAVEYDWAAGVARTRYEDGESELTIEPGTLDASTLSVWLQAALARGEREWTLDQVDEDEVEQVRFRARTDERIDTALGCLDVIVVEKVRDPSSKRYTRTHYAPALNHAPVRVEHGKQGGNELQSRLVALTVNGEPVDAGPGCDG